MPVALEVRQVTNLSIISAADSMIILLEKLHIDGNESFSKVILMLFPAVTIDGAPLENPLLYNVTIGFSG
ncbi:MAG: hypothetical protein ACLRZZ_28545 [Enterocloster sp.]